MLANPSTIYLNLVPFCPRKSLIALAYGKRRPGGLSVAGLPSENWDDRLASVSVEEDKMISSVLATESYFLNIIRSVVMIIVWHSEILQQAHQIVVGKYVAVVALNRAGIRNLH